MLRLPPIRASLCVLSLVLAACPGSGTDFTKKTSGPKDPPATAASNAGVHTFRVAVLPLGGLYDDEPDDTAPGANTLGTDDFEAAVHAAAAVLESAQVDIAITSGIGTERALAAIGADPALTAPLPFYGFSHGNDATGLGVGVLSKLPIGRVTSHASDHFGTSGFSHDCLEAHLSLPNHEVVFFSTLFAAGDMNASERTAEATAARLLCSYALASDPYAEVILGGDFEDAPGSATFAALAGDPPLVPTGAQTTGFEEQFANAEMAGFRDATSVLLGDPPDPALAKLGAHPALFATYTVP